MSLSLPCASRSRTPGCRSSCHLDLTRGVITSRNSSYVATLTEWICAWMANGSRRACDENQCVLMLSYTSSPDPTSVRSACTSGPDSGCVMSMAARAYPRHPSAVPPIAASHCSGQERRTADTCESTTTGERQPAPLGAGGDPRHAHAKPWSRCRQPRADRSKAQAIAIFSSCGSSAPSSRSRSLRSGTLGAAVRGRLGREI